MKEDEIKCINFTWIDVKYKDKLQTPKCQGLMTEYLPSMSELLSSIFRIEKKNPRRLAFGRFGWVSIVMEKNLCILHSDLGNRSSHSVKQSIFKHNAFLHFCVHLWNHLCLSCYNKG